MALCDSEAENGSSPDDGDEDSKTKVPHFWPNLTEYTGATFATPENAIALQIHSSQFTLYLYTLYAGFYLRLFVVGYMNPPDAVAPPMPPGIANENEKTGERENHIS